MTDTLFRGVSSSVLEQAGTSSASSTARQLDFSQAADFSRSQAAAGPALKCSEDQQKAPAPTTRNGELSLGKGNGADAAQQWSVNSKAQGDTGGNAERGSEDDGSSGGCGGSGSKPPHSSSRGIQSPPGSGQQPSNGRSISEHVRNAGDAAQARVDRAQQQWQAGAETVAPIAAGFGVTCAVATLTSPVTEVLLNVASNVAEVVGYLPFAAPLGHAIVQLLKAVQNTRANKDACKALGRRVESLQLLLYTAMPVLKQAGVTDDAGMAFW